MKRREFLRGTAGAAALASANGVLWSKDDPQRRLACNSWPFRGYFDTPQMHRYRDPKYPLLTQAEFPAFLADHFGIHNVEFLPQHFADTGAASIEKVKQALKAARSHCCNLMGVEFPGGVFTRGADRQAIAQEAERWGAIATALGAPSITIALTGQGPADAHTAAYNLTPAVNVLHRRGMKVLFHNDSMKRESAELLTGVIQELGPNRTGACPDFGNFAVKSAAFALSQLRMLAPYASNICHAKNGIAEDGKFYADDFSASMSVMRDAGFRGVYSLEFEGLGDPVDGVRKLKELTEAKLS